MFLFATNTVLASNSKINSFKYNTFDDYPVYLKSDLGVTYSPKKSTIKLWSPNVEETKINLYQQGHCGNPTQVENLYYDFKTGVWEITLIGDCHNIYYTLQVKNNGKWSAAMPDPYAKGVGVNGNRGLIFDAKRTNPTGWNSDKKPELKSFSDIVIYEAHVRDFSIDGFSGINNKGKFLGITEKNTKNDFDQPTGLDHLKEMGITHLHVLPCFDYKFVDESKLDKKQYNWGYDPQNYNVPEGSYSTNPFDGLVRIQEFKLMVQSLHQSGIRLVMDVVYNHTSSTAIFDELVPGYYYRTWSNGKRSDATDCGNEFASDRIMGRYFMLESLKYWITEYHVDGFRFDLMAVHDIETMNLISKELHQLDSSIFLYGEGWTARDSPLPLEKRAIKNNTKKLNQIAVFSDDIRDGVKGHCFNITEKGFVSGNPNLKAVIHFGIVASTYHPQVKYNLNRNYAQFPYSDSPTKVIGYVSCHDNNTLYDKLKISNPKATNQELLEMNRLASTIIFTSQSIPFLLMGEEMQRSKNGLENSYKSPDNINKINWDLKYQNQTLVDYYKKLIQLRKNHPAFKMPSKKMIQKHLEFLDLESPLLVGYTIKEYANGDSWKNIRVYYNGDSKAIAQKLIGTWNLVCNGENIDEKGLYQITSNFISIPARSAMILYQD